MADALVPFDDAAFTGGVCYLLVVDLVCHRLLLTSLTAEMFTQLCLLLAFQFDGLLDG